MDARIPIIQGQWYFFHFSGVYPLFLAGILTDVGPPYALELLFRVIAPPSSARAMQRNSNQFERLEKWIKCILCPEHCARFLS